MSMTRARSAIFMTIAWGFFVGLLVRLRIEHDAPLPPIDSFGWLLAGTLQDVAVLLCAAAAALAIVRRWPRTAVALFVVFVAITNVLHIIRSEAVVFFGDVIRPEDLHGDIPLTLAAGSLRGTPAFLFVVALLTGAMIPLLTKRFAVGWLRFRDVVAAALVAVGAAAAVTGMRPDSRLGRNVWVALFDIEQEAMESPHQRFENEKPSINPISIRRFAGKVFDRTYTDADYPLAYLDRGADDAVSASWHVRPNIVFLLMESVRAEEVGCYGADPPGVTPNIDALASNGIRVDPAYSAGTYTASAELATWYGLPPIPREILITSRPALDATGLPEILRYSGWRSFVWIHGGDSNFYRRDSFYIPRGVKVVDARSFPPRDPNTNWGYSDRSLARNAVTVLNRLREPFAAMLLTLSNHHPFELPQDAGPPMALPATTNETRGRRTADMVQTVHYTDQAIGDFVREARTRPWFAHTIFIITGDHGLTTPPYERPIAGDEELLDLMHRVPLILYSPLLPRGITIRGPASHIDLMPTILGLIHAPVVTGLGVDLFDENALRSRVLPMWSLHQRALTLATRTRVYRAWYESGGPLEAQTPVEALFDPARDPAGMRNLIDVERDTAKTFRELAKIYVTVYPWLVVHGNSGLPPDLLRRERVLPPPPRPPHVVAQSTSAGS